MSLLFSALYATCPDYLVLPMQSSNLAGGPVHGPERRAAHRRPRPAMHTTSRRLTYTYAYACISMFCVQVCFGGTTNTFDPCIRPIRLALLAKRW